MPDYFMKKDTYASGEGSVCPTDAAMPYPRICAHRGFSTVAPENTLPAYGAAVGLGADEIELDLWETADGVIVSCHDSSLDRVSTGSGLVREKTYAELLELDFGVKHSPRFAGLRIASFEDILRAFTGRTIMNIHIKPDDINMTEIMRLIRKYNAQDYCYFMGMTEVLLGRLRDEAPEIPRCFGGFTTTWNIVETAVKYGCKKIQMFKPCYSREIIDDAHKNGIICNIFWSDDPGEAKMMLDMGIDCILTNDFQIVNEAAKEWLKEKK
ncbi:MAG: hypothetical protein E7632_04995 [Ruminococcaceae bacterium]|nr:hypothetical protein [Oscillospiraceae bacterium]